jgi:hypothetical protein
MAMHQDRGNPYCLHQEARLSETPLPAAPVGTSIYPTFLQVHHKFTQHVVSIVAVVCNIGNIGALGTGDPAVDQQDRQAARMLSSICRGC